LFFKLFVSSVTVSYCDAGEIRGDTWRMRKRIAYVQ